MTPAEFVQFMEELAPSIDSLRAERLSLAEAMRFRATYECPPRAQPRVYDGRANEIVDLVCRWDISTLRIGMVEFLPTPVQLPNALHVGFFEVDMLVILNDSQEVYVVDEVVSTHLMWPVAATTGKCLDALAHLAQSLDECAANEPDMDTPDFDARRAAARRCSSLAGGDKYYDFYSVSMYAEP